MARRKRRTTARARLQLVALPIAVVALAVVIWFIATSRGERPPAPPPEFGERLMALAQRRGAAAADIVADQPIRKLEGVFVRTWRITLPDRASVEGLKADLGAEAAGWRGAVTELPATGSDVDRLRVELGIEAFDVRLLVAPGPRHATAGPRPVATVRPTATPRPEPPPGARGRLALILDDGGQRMDLVKAAAALPVEVAVSVLPFLPHSADTAIQLHRSGHEVWVHLPMEAVEHPQPNPGPGAILVDMSEEEIRTAVHAALNSVPHAVGVNNHMGSRATTVLRVMTWVMQELSARGMAFIDSRTSVNTVAETAARAQGVPTNRRHIFLDNRPTRAAVRRQLDEAVYMCRMEGEVIAIGHITNRVTVEVLEEELPGIKARGADLVPPTELVR